MRPLVNVSVIFTVGEGVPQAIVTLFEDLLIVRLLKVVAEVPPIVCAELPVKSIVPAVVKVPLFVKLPEMLSVLFLGKNVVPLPIVKLRPIVSPAFAVTDGACRHRSAKPCVPSAQSRWRWRCWWWFYLRRPARW